MFSVKGQRVSLSGFVGARILSQLLHPACGITEPAQLGHASVTLDLQNRYVGRPVGLGVLAADALGTFLYINPFLFSLRNFCERQTVSGESMEKHPVLLQKDGNHGDRNSEPAQRRCVLPEPGRFLLCSKGRPARLSEELRAYQHQTRRSPSREGEEVEKQQGVHVPRWHIFYPGKRSYARGFLTLRSGRSQEGCGKPGRSCWSCDLGDPGQAAGRCRTHGTKDSGCGRELWGPVSRPEPDPEGR